MNQVTLTSPPSWLATPAAINDGLFLFLLLIVKGVAKECINSSGPKGFWCKFLDTHVFAIVSFVKPFWYFVCWAVFPGDLHFVCHHYFFVLLWLIRCIRQRTTFIVGLGLSWAQIFQMGTDNLFVSNRGSFLALVNPIFPSISHLSI